MPQVFTGKVVIPGDKLDEYFNLLKEAENARKPFKENLIHLNREFEKHLRAKYNQRTSRKHASIIEMFIEFLCGYTDVEKIEEITKGMVNTHFKKWYKRKVIDSSTENDLRVALKKFFLFLSLEKNISNEKVLQALE